MTKTYKNLGQSAPSAATATALYTVPASTSAIVSSIVIANRSATATAFRVSVRVAGAAENDKQYLAYDCPIQGNEIITLTIGVALAATDVLYVYNTLATCSFNAFGVTLA